MANDSKHASHTGVRDYVVIALILGVITYIEFAIVEYDIAWLSSSAILWSLMILSVLKFVLVVMFFMHLKDDDAAYTGFFSSGMLMALGTFIVLAFLMTAPASLSMFRSDAAPGADAAAQGEPGEGLAEAAAEEGGRLQVEPPAAEGDFALAETDAAGAPEEGAAAEDGEPAAEAAAGGDWDQALGEEVYAANCASCHQANGQGIPGAFPPLAGNASTLAAAEGGRTYLTHALLFGVQGPIEVQGQTYNGVMPGWQQLDDAQIAAVVNHIVHLDAAPEGFAPITADEVAAERGAGLSPQDVHAERP